MFLRRRLVSQRRAGNFDESGRAVQELQELGDLPGGGGEETWSSVPTFNKRLSTGFMGLMGL